MKTDDPQPHGASPATERLGVFDPSNLPRGAAEREALRMEVLEKYLLRAQWNGTRAFMSLRCASGDHGCRNDGSGCSCLCHDR